MENKLSPVQMLDKVLEWFSLDVREMGLGEQQRERLALDRHDALRLAVDKFPELDTEEFRHYSTLIMAKLARDGYLIEVPYEGFSITFDGKFFHQQGGYAKKIEQEEYEAWLNKKLRTTTIDNNVSANQVNKLFWATITVAGIGAIASLLSFLKDVL